MRPNESLEDKYDICMISDTGAESSGHENRRPSVSGVSQRHHRQQSSGKSQNITVCASATLPETLLDACVSMLYDHWIITIHANVREITDFTLELPLTAY